LHRWREAAASDRSATRFRRGAETVIPCVEDPAEVSDDTTFLCVYVKEKGDAGVTYYFATLDDAWCAASGPNRQHYESVGCEMW
jgi:hypothetical protein